MKPIIIDETTVLNAMSTEEIYNYLNARLKYEGQPELIQKSTFVVDFIQQNEELYDQLVSLVDSGHFNMELLLGKVAVKRVMKSLESTKNKVLNENS